MICETRDRNVETGSVKVCEFVLSSRPFSTWTQTWYRIVAQGTGVFVEPFTRPDTGMHPYHAGGSLRGTAIHSVMTASGVMF